MATMSLSGGAVFNSPEPIRGTGLAAKLLNAY